MKNRNDDVDLIPVTRFLRSAKDAAIQAARHNERAINFWDACTRVTSSASGMPGGGGNTREDKLVLYCDACSEELAGLWEERKRQQQIADFLTQIPNDTERSILQLRYLDYLSWPRICVLLEDVGIYYSERHIKRLHKQALISAAIIYNDLSK